jgi:hypothetical protein
VFLYRFFDPRVGDLKEASNVLSVVIDKALSHSENVQLIAS